MTLTTDQHRRPIVQRKTAWTDTWVEVPRGTYALDRITEGGCGGMGSASMETWDTGTPNREAKTPTPVNLAVDQFVRVGALAPHLSPSDDDYIRWLWTGFIASREFDHLGTEEQGTETSFIVYYTNNLEGLGSLFRRVRCQRSTIRLASGTRTSLQRALRFNDKTHGTAIGNRSAAADGSGLYAHDLSRSASVTWWTAKQALERLLADHLGSRFPNWPTVVIAGQTTALNAIDTWDVTGLSLDEAISLISGQRRGIAWTLEPGPNSGDPVTLRITSGLSAAVTIPAGGGIPAITLPASDRQVALALTGDSHLSVTSRLINRPRNYKLQGRVLSQVTLRWRPSGGTADDGLVRGWASGDDSFAGSTDPKYRLVGRFFRLGSAWTGKGYLDSLTIPANSQGPATDLELLATGFSGVRTRSGSPFPADACRLDGTLLTPEVASTDGTSVAPEQLKNWATGSTLLPIDAPRDRIRAWVTRTPGSSYVEATDAYQVQVTNDPAQGILFGTTAADGAALLASIGTSGELLITLTVEEPLPLIMSRAAANAVTDELIPVDAEYQWVAGGTVVGVETTGALIRCTAAKVIRDDRPQAAAALAALGMYLDRQGTASLRDGLTLRKADDIWRPGSLIINVDDGRGSAYAFNLSSIVTRRTWNFGIENYGTDHELEPLSLDLRSYL